MEKNNNANNTDNNSVKIEEKPPDKLGVDWKTFTSCDCGCQHTKEHNFACAGCGICYHQSVNLLTGTACYESLQAEYYEYDCIFLLILGKHVGFVQIVMLGF